MHHRLHFSFKLHKLSYQIFLLGGQRNSSFPLKEFYFEKKKEKNMRTLWYAWGKGQPKWWRMYMKRWSLLETCFCHCCMRCKDIIFGVLLKTKSCHLSIHPRKFELYSKYTIAWKEVIYLNFSCLFSFLSWKLPNIQKYNLFTFISWKITCSKYQILVIRYIPYFHISKICGMV